jgi:hypothetical protein
MVFIIGCFIFIITVIACIVHITCHTICITWLSLLSQLLPFLFYLCHVLLQHTLQANLIPYNVLLSFLLFIQIVATTATTLLLTTT